MSTPISATYSFLDVTVTISGPGLQVTFDGDVAEEGITLDMIADKNTMTIGAGGGGMHSLHASQAGRVTVNLLKTGPANAILSSGYNFQQGSSAFWGQNFLTINNPVSGDNITGQHGAFVRQSPVVYATIGGMNCWAFDFVSLDEILGDGFIATGV